MAEFWEQQLMDRIMALAFEFRKSGKEMMPKDHVQDIIDYVKFLLREEKASRL